LGELVNVDRSSNKVEGNFPWIICRRELILLDGWAKCMSNRAVKVHWIELNRAEEQFCDTREIIRDLISEMILSNKIE
jgi:hypothetical protein